MIWHVSQCPLIRWYSRFGGTFYIYTDITGVGVINCDLDWWCLMYACIVHLKGRRGRCRRTRKGTVSNVKKTKQNKCRICDKVLAIFLPCTPGWHFSHFLCCVFKNIHMYTEKLQSTYARPNVALWFLLFEGGRRRRPGPLCICRSSSLLSLKDGVGRRQSWTFYFFLDDLLDLVHTK